MSLLPSLPDFKDITARVEHGQGEIAARLDAIIALLNRLTQVMSAPRSNSEGSRNVA